MNLKQAEAQYEQVLLKKLKFKSWYGTAGTLNSFMVFLGPNRDPNDVFLLDIQAFLDMCRAKGNSPSTIKDKWRICRAFWDYMRSEGICDHFHDPFNFPRDFSQRRNPIIL